MAGDDRYLKDGNWRWNGFEWVPADAPVQQPRTAAESLGWSPRTLMAIGGGLAVLLVGLVGVAVGFRATTKPPPVLNLTAAQIVAQAGEQTRTTDSYHLVGVASAGDGERFEISQQDPSTVEIVDTIGNVSAQAVQTDGRFYVNANAAFFQKYNPGLVGVAGRWLIFPQDMSAGPLTSVNNFRNSLVCSMSKPVPWRRAADTTVAGTPVYHVYVSQNGDRVDLYVASEGIPYVMRIVIAVTSQNVTVAYRTARSQVSGQCNGGIGANRPATNTHWQMDFDHWGDAVRIGVPSEPIPLVRKATTS